MKEIEILIAKYKRQVSELNDICAINDEQMYKVEAERACYVKFIDELDAVRRELNK